MIEIVSATRYSEPEFWTRSALGNSLRRLGRDNRLVARVAFANSRGLPDVFNGRITGSAHPYLVFMHDDVWIDDYFIGDRIIEGLREFDILGVAGNRRRVAGQPSWAFLDDKFAWDTANLSGAVAHGDTPSGQISWFGATPAECELLDGVFIAARRASLVDKAVRFDPQFRFHFYDMDLCRTARASGLRIGTWPICITHQSGGAFNTPAWKDARRAYVAKWND